MGLSSIRLPAKSHVKTFSLFSSILGRAPQQIVSDSNQMLQEQLYDSTEDKYSSENKEQMLGRNYQY